MIPFAALAVGTSRVQMVSVTEQVESGMWLANNLPWRARSS